MWLIMYQEDINVKTKILNMLRQAQDYISGQRLCDELNVSRTAIWKYMNQLKAEGYVIDSVSNKGYCLLETPDLVTKSEILSQLTTKWLGQEIGFFEVTDSTNIQAKKLAEAGCVHGTLVVADQQDQGKGRRGNGWVSPKGSDIFMTIVLRPNIKTIHAPMLTLVMALAVSKGIDEVTGLVSYIKWPNDIVVNNKKVCGILTEMTTEMDDINYVVIGAGVNVNRTTFSTDIEDKATSLCLESGSNHNRAFLINSILNAFEYYYDLFIKKENLSDLMEDYNNKLINTGKEVRIINDNKSEIKIALGIDKDGGLMVENADGSVDTIISGEVSVRGIYGYV